MRTGGLAAAVVVLAAAACGQEGASPVPRSSGADGDPAAGVTSPPPLVLQRPEGEIDLPAYAWCLHQTGASACAEGAPPTHPPRTSATAPLAFTFPLEGWTFTAAFRRPGRPADCQRVTEADVVARGGGAFLVPLPARAGTWEVQLSGSSGPGGSLATSLAWTTAADSTAALPARGTVMFLGPPTTSSRSTEAYGPSLALTGLPADPADVSAELVVVGAGGMASYPLHAADHDTCPDDGTVVLQGDDADTSVDLTGLGEPPYIHQVLLTLDGTEYAGTARWPDDLSPALSNQLRLTWSPPLPAWGTTP